MYFDGNCANKLGSGGYVIYDTEGLQIEGVGVYYGLDARTNNEAEVETVRRAM